MSDAFLVVLLEGDEATRSNPLASIDADTPKFVTQCHRLACQLLARHIPKRHGPWSASAELVLTALLAFVCACEPNPSERNLRTVRRILGDRRKLDLAFETMVRHDDIPAIAELGTWYMSNYGRG